jgi:hypothetical protein
MASPDPEQAAISTAPPPGGDHRRVDVAIHSALEAMNRELDRAAMERFLDSRNRGPGSLLAAWELTQDIRYLREAAASHPDVPAVQLAMVLHPDTSAEERRTWLEKLGTSDPHNAFPDMLAAADAFAAGNTQAAIDLIQTAAEKSALDHFGRNMILEREDLLRSLGFDPLSASLRAFLSPNTAFQISHRLHPMIRGFAAAMEQQTKSGNRESAEETISAGLSLFRRLQDPETAHYIITNMMGMAGESALLNHLPPDQVIPGDIVTVAERQKELQGYREEFRRLLPLSTQLNFMEPEFIETYVERAKSFGEIEAMRWAEPILESRKPGE